MRLRVAMLPELEYAPGRLILATGKKIVKESRLDSSRLIGRNSLGPSIL